MKKKIFIFFESEIFINNFVNTNGIDLLFKKYNCFFLIDEKIKDKFKYYFPNKYKERIKNKTFFYTYSNFERKIFSLIFFRNQIKNQHKSKNIKIAITNNIFFNFERNDEISVYKKIIKTLVVFKRFFILKSNEIFTNNFIDLILKKMIKKNIIIKNLIKYAKPDLLIIPYHGGHISIFDAIRCSKQTNTKVLLLSENWDSVFSRAYVNFPDYISFWGEQSKKFFKDRYKNKTKLFSLGAPRLNSYFSFRKKTTFRKKFKIIFYDRAIPDNVSNHKLFSYMNALINKKQNNLKNLKFVYRPHPYTFLNFREKYEFKKFDKVKLEKSSKKIYKLNNNTSLVQKTKFTEAIKLLDSADLVICSASSLVIEASILYKKIIIYNVSSGGFFKNRLPSNYEHFKGLDKLKNITFANSNEELGDLIMKFYKNKNEPKKNLIDKERGYILKKNTNNSYSRDLLNCVNKILK